MTPRGLWLLIAVCFVAAAAGAAPAAPPPAQRTFLFTYSGQVSGLAPGQQARLWLPMPPTNDSQQVALVEMKLLGKPTPIPTKWVVSQGPNRILTFDAAGDDAGTIPFTITYRVTRFELGSTPIDKKEKLDAYLQPSQLIPIGGKPAQVLLAGKTVPGDPLAAGQFLYDVVDDAMQYRKDKPGWGHGDANWACESRFGNCTDFHSLFISLARTEHLPAKFEMGFEIPAKKGVGQIAGYHCWAEFAANGQWVPVDIAHANLHPERRAYYFGHLDENRVLFTVGRDLTLSPPQAGPPLNYFIYPYVEVAGKPWPADKIAHSFSYEDVK